MGFSKNFPVNTENLEQVLTLLSEGKNVTTLWLPKMSRTEFASKLQNTTLINSITEDKFTAFLKETIFVFSSLNLVEKYFFLQLEEELLNYSNKKGTRAKIKALADSGKNVVLIIDNFNFRNIELLQYLITLQQINLDKVRFLFVALESDFNKEKFNLEDFGVFYENMVQFNYLSFNDFVEWYKANKDKFKVNLNQNLLHRIYDFTGGMLGMIKVIFENYLKYKELERVFSSIEMVNYLRSVWDRFTLRERKVIKSVIGGKRLPPYSIEIAYLRSHGLINKQNKINADWFNYLIEKPAKLNLSLIEDSIYWDDMNVSELLKARDNKILVALFNAQGELLTREQLAEIIWGVNWHKDYSNWALDQSLSRLRRKLKEIGMPDVVKSTKGKGFYLAS